MEADQIKHEPASSTPHSDAELAAASGLNQSWTLLTTESRAAWRRLLEDKPLSNGDFLDLLEELGPGSLIDHLGADRIKNPSLREVWRKFRSQIHDLEDVVSKNGSVDVGCEETLAEFVDAHGGLFFVVGEYTEVFEKIDPAAAALAQTALQIQEELIQAYSAEEAEAAPPPQKITSKTIKAHLAAVYGGREKDWKRGSKTKNADGEAVRVFTNEPLGLALTVTEALDGSLRCESGAAGSAASQSVKAPKAAQKLSGTVIEADPAKNAAADQIVEILLGKAAVPANPGKLISGVPESLVTSAGAALANRYCFAVSSEYLDGLSVFITPIRYFEERGHCSDRTGPIASLLPDCCNEAESLWSVQAKGARNAVQIAQYLQKLGFHWHSGFQNYIDADLTEKLSAKVQSVR